MPHPDTVRVERPVPDETLSVHERIAYRIAAIPWRPEAIGLGDPPVRVGDDGIQALGQFGPSAVQRHDDDVREHVQIRLEREIMEEKLIVHRAREEHRKALAGPWVAGQDVGRLDAFRR